MQNSKGEDETDVTFKSKRSEDSNREGISLIQNEYPTHDVGKTEEPLVERKVNNDLLAVRSRELPDDEDDAREHKHEHSSGTHKDSKHENDNDKRSEADDKHDGAESVVVSVGDDLEALEKSEKPSNSLAAKKTVAQGMMDIALLTANANQLRFMLEYNRHSATFLINVVLIVISLILQVGVGIALICKGRFDIRGESKKETAKRINNYVVVGVFLVTIINVFIASFTVTGGSPTNEKPVVTKQD